eukprot:5403114-Karenia_brevis.AAC.1
MLPNRRASLAARGLSIGSGPLYHLRADDTTVASFSDGECTYSEHSLPNLDVGCTGGPPHSQNT